MLFMYKYFYIYKEFIFQKLLFIGKSTSNIEVVPINILLRLRSKNSLSQTYNYIYPSKAGNMAIQLHLDHKCNCAPYFYVRTTRIFPPTRVVVTSVINAPLAHFILIKDRSQCSKSKNCAQSFKN
jgi:hypothetical protein